MVKINDTDIPYLEFAEAAAPGTPAAAITRIYVKTDGLMYSKDDAGAETLMSGGAAGAPSTADYLVGTANGSLSAEIVVGTTPGGELGGTWGTPTVDATHSGSAHAAYVPLANFSVNADSSADVTLTADTIADATGVSVSLVAGTWIIWGEMTFSATTATYDYCLFNITDSANTVFGEARNDVASNSPQAYMCFAVVTPGSTTTYKLRGQSGRTGNKILRYGQGTNIGTRMVALKVA